MTVDREPGAAALLVMDVQRAIVDRVGDAADLLGRLARATAAARAAGVPVYYVFRRGYPEVSPRNLRFSAMTGAGHFVDGDPSGEIHPAVAPRADDVVVTKKRSAEVHRVLLEKVFPRQAEVMTVGGWAE